MEVLGPIGTRPANDFHFPLVVHQKNVRVAASYPEEFQGITERRRGAKGGPLLRIRLRGLL
jgi:hypothetical protein